jgi:UDP-N-acetylmuramate--alanine ligase
MFTNIFFVGIGGKGLNGIAKICLEKGYKVSGVDTMSKNETTALETGGAKIYYSHSAQNITRDIDIVVYTSLAKDAPEIIEAERLNILTMKRSRFLGMLTRHDFRICVAGSHGKSTTTALLGLSAISSGVDATIFGGAYAKEFAGYNHLGNSKYTIIEACEFDRSFHDLIANASILTSVEKSHLEYYKDEDEMLESFKYFFNQHKKNAVIFTNGDSEKCRLVTAEVECPVIFFGRGRGCEYRVVNMKKERNGSMFSVKYDGKLLVKDLRINIPGEYNVMNFAACIAFMHHFKIPLKGILETAHNFTGVGRRFEIKTARSGQIFVDDFAHHPSQVKDLMKSIRQFYPDKRVCAVFQPRQFNMMKNFVREYGEAFSQADEVIITEILPALNDTEEDKKSISTIDMMNSISKLSNRPVKIINDFKQISDYISENFDSQSVVTTIGAGDIYKVRDIMMTQ